MANKIFEANPSLKSYHETSDGNCFYHPQDARNHAKTLEDKSVTEVKNPKLKDEATGSGTSDTVEQPYTTAQYPMNATNTAKAASECKTLEELEQYSADERKTVIAAYEKRKAELTAQTAGTTDAGAGTEPQTGTEPGEGAKEKTEGAAPDNSEQKPE